MVEFASVNLLSASGHRDAARVTACGCRGIRGITAGPEIRAGSLSFTSIDEDALGGILQYWWSEFGNRSSLLSVFDIPPFDLIVLLSQTDIHAEFSTGFILRQLLLVDDSKVIGTSRPVVNQEYAFICAGSTPIVPSDNSNTYSGKLSDSIPTEYHGIL
jgi:hypothetical protein